MVHNKIRDAFLGLSFLYGDGTNTVCYNLVSLLCLPSGKVRGI